MTARLGLAILPIAKAEWIHLLALAAALGLLALSFADWSAQDTAKPA
ncbi:MAG: hypothetical protein GY717_17950 [Rhodobacteraceae bacterium]|nr:hypothetical protein [Paracoccaceae bacterium]